MVPHEVLRNQWCFHHVLCLLLQLFAARQGGMRWARRQCLKCLSCSRSSISSQWLRALLRSILNAKFIRQGLELIFLVPELAPHDALGLGELSLFFISHSGLFDLILHITNLFMQRLDLSSLILSLQMVISRSHLSFGDQGREISESYSSLTYLFILHWIRRTLFYQRWGLVIWQRNRIVIRNFWSANRLLCIHSLPLKSMSLLRLRLSSLLFLRPLVSWLLS